MPEMITKYPDLAIDILKSANIPCGENIKPTILTTCPKKDFCSLPQGEICVYGVKDTLKSTQIAGTDLLMISGFWISYGLLILMGFLGGFYLGTRYKKR